MDGGRIGDEKLPGIDRRIGRGSDAVRGEMNRCPWRGTAQSNGHRSAGEVAAIRRNTGSRHGWQGNCQTEYGPERSNSLGRHGSGPVQITQAILNESSRWQLAITTIGKGVNGRERAGGSNHEDRAVPVPALMGGAVEITIARLEQPGLRARPVRAARERVQSGIGAVGTDPEHGTSARVSPASRGPVEPAVRSLNQISLGITAVRIAAAMK